MYRYFLEMTFRLNYIFIVFGCLAAKHGLDGRLFDHMTKVLLEMKWNFVTVAWLTYIAE